MKEIISRFLASTPTFFKRIIALGITIGGVGAALLVPDVANQLPPVFGEIAGYMVTAGVVAGVLAKLTVSNPDDIKK